MKYSDPKTGTDAEVIGSVLFIKGTTEKADMLLNFDLIPIKRYGAIGHRGAYRSARWIMENIPLREIKEIHGHSLGGAVAQWLNIMTGKLTETYGSFRPFFKGQSDNCVNYIRWGDFIPFLFLFRKNIGKNIYLPFEGFKKAHMNYDLIIWRK